MKIHKVGIIMNMTGRMGTNQHLMRSIVAIREEGDQISDHELFCLNPFLVGRNERKLQRLSEMSGITIWTTDLDSVLRDPQYPIYFDAQTTTSARQCGQKRFRPENMSIAKSQPP